MDIKDLVERAKAVGHDEVPVGGGNSSEVVEVLSAIFDGNDGKFFRSQDLAKLLNDNSVPVTKIGNTLFAMKNQRKCSQVKKGVYTSYSSEYDSNITAPSAKEPTED